MQKVNLLLLEVHYNYAGTPSPAINFYLTIYINIKVESVEWNRMIHFSPQNSQNIATGPRVRESMKARLKFLTTERAAQANCEF